jgi:hemerythrin superfamily protein
MAEIGHDDAVRIVKDQHEQIRDLFRSVLTTGSGRDEPFEALVRLLAVHETAEEMVIYPVVEKEGDDGARIVAARRAEEDEAKKSLADIEKLDRDSTEFETSVATLRSSVEAHADAEEREVLPVLEQVKDADALARMARAFKVAETMAPTHPHKAAPESAVGNAVVGPFVALVDRARDAIRDATR